MYLYNQIIPLEIATKRAVKNKIFTSKEINLKLFYVYKMGNI